MRITKEQARENREHVVKSAARLFREKGFDGVGVAELMRAAGLTHGGFYNHFESKEDVEAAACERVFAKSVAGIAAIAAIPDPEARRLGFDDYCRRYVSLAARDAAAPSCPMVAFAGDMARRPPELREVFASGLVDYLDAFAGASGADAAEATRRFCTLVGALTLARGVVRENPELSEAILRAASPGASAPPGSSPTKEEPGPGL